MRSLMLLSHGKVANDPRVLWEAERLSAAGWEVLIFCWDRTGSLPAEETCGKVQIRRYRRPDTFGEGVKQLRGFLGFWREAVRQGARWEYDAVHAHDLDTLLPAWRLARRQGVPLIYDAHEPYAEMQRHHVLLFLAARFLEAMLIPRVTCVATVGELMADYFRPRVGNNVPIHVIGNWREPKDFAGLSYEAERSARGLLPEHLVVGYFGQITRRKPRVEELFAALEGRPRVRVLLAGWGDEVPRVEKRAKSDSRVAFAGFVDWNEMLRLLVACDLVYYNLDPDYGENHFSCPNNLFLALAAGKPMLCIDLGEVGKIVRRWECGYLMKTGTAEEVAAGLDWLSRPESLQKTQQAARRACRERYNADRAAQELLGIYAAISGRQAPSTPFARGEEKHGHSAG